MTRSEFSTKILLIIDEIRNLRNDIQPEVNDGSLWMETSDILTTVLVGFSELEQCVGHGHGNLNFFRYRSPPDAPIPEQPDFHEEEGDTEADPGFCE